MRLDIADMSLFVCIADAGSITGGARRANLALASASERLKNIELDAGVSLLVRHPRGVSLTEAGELFVHHARQILSQRELLKAELSAFANGSRGKLKLYANTAAIAEFLPRKLSAWLSEHPDIAIELEERTSADIVNIIASGIGEAGLVSDAVNAQSLTLEPVADDQLVLIIPPQHPLSHADALSLSDVVTESFIGLYPGNALQENISQHAANLGYSLSFRIRMSSFEGFCEMVSNGIGVGILPESVADRFQHKFAFSKRPLTDAWAKRKICLCYRDRSLLSPAMKKLLTFLQETVS
ncbi:LysR family transcriptional regulator [Kluyvera cryocrescens]|uniref:LysR family transcriptional regulator n=1 Tax=Kluyvera cryocrescens TaxID=580 RepID=UPI0039F6E2C0